MRNSRKNTLFGLPVDARNWQKIPFYVHTLTSVKKSSVNIDTGGTRKIFFLFLHKSMLWVLIRSTQQNAFSWKNKKKCQQDLDINSTLSGIMIKILMQLIQDLILRT